ncbi:hypothetical protein D3C78_1393230 [compost metagenome]
MSRLGIPGLAKKDKAKSFKAAHPMVLSIREHIENRVGGIESGKVQEVLDDLQNRIDRWQKKTMGKSLVYSNAKTKANLMFPLGRKAKNAEFAVPNSMRDVEKTIGIYLKG